MKVSILVPVYNVEKYLERCMESLCSQTLREIEIICINDGSTDTSRDILEIFAKKDKRIIVIDKKNTGYGNSMNMGLDIAKGEYVAIVESDDFIENDMMETLYINAKQSSVDFIKSNCFFFSDNDKKEKNEFVNLFEGLLVGEVLKPIEYQQFFLKMPAIWSGMYLREFLIRNQIRFHETAGASYQDISFNFQVLACADRGIFVKKAYYHYRINNINSSVKVPGKVFCVCDELNQIERFIESRKEKEYVLKKILSRLAYKLLLEHYNALDSAFQYALFLKIVEYLKRYKEAGYITSEIWDREAIEDAEKILKNSSQYFMKTAKAFEDKRIVDKNSPALNHKLYIEIILKTIIESQYIIIYGAGKIGRTILKYLLLKNYKKDRICFAVSDIKDNQGEIEEISVLSIDECLEWKDKASVIVAVKEQNQFEILQILEKKLFRSIISIDNIVWSFIKEKWNL